MDATVSKNKFVFDVRLPPINLLAVVPAWIFEERRKMDKMESLRQERDQLQARVAELEEVAGVYVRDSYRPSPKYDAQRFDALVDTLNRIPRQSLARVRAQALREVLTKLAIRRSRTLSVSNTVAFIADEADRIEQEVQDADH